jgi:GNAT superfamily N-acetyltransferase
MRCSRCCASVSEVSVALASVDDVRIIARRRGFDEAGFRVALELADRGVVWAARDQAEVVGIAIAHASEDERYVGDLFVEPSFRGQGIGSRLLEAAFDDADDVARAMLVDPADPASIALALRFRCVPRELLLTIAGAIPREQELAKMAAGDYRFSVEPIDLATHQYALDGLDRETRGTVRSGDHRFFTQHALGHIFGLNGDIVAYAYVWPDGRIGPIASTSQAYLVQVLAFTLVTMRRQHQASWCSLLVPGSNIRVARAGLRAGLRVQQGGELAADSLFGNVSSYVGYHTLLF